MNLEKEDAKMKKWLVFVMVACVLMGAAGCGKSTGEPARESAAAETMPAQTAPPKTEKPAASENSGTPPAPEVKPPKETEMPDKAAKAEKISTQSLSWTDNAGYLLEGEFGLSDWIHDEDILTATWKSVAGNREIPSFGKHIKIGEKLPSEDFNCMDIAYAVGYFQIRNKTPGFDVQASNPANVGFDINPNTPYFAMAIPWGNGTSIYMPDDSYAVPILTDNLQNCRRECLIDKEELVQYWDDGLCRSVTTGVTPKTTMTSNQTTKMPFLVALGMISIPKHPEMMPDPARVVIEFIAWDIADGGIKMRTCNFAPQKTWE